MGEPACDLLDAELGLDRLEAELAGELPAHMRAFAAAYAAGAPAPPAPAAARRASAIGAARRALVHPVLADRAVALLRVLVPIALDDDPRVQRALGAERTWPAYEALVAARDAVAHARFGRGHIAVLHAMHGTPEPVPSEHCADIYMTVRSGVPGTTMPPWGEQIAPAAVVASAVYVMDPSVRASRGADVRPEPQLEEQAAGDLERRRPDDVRGAGPQPAADDRRDRAGESDHGARAWTAACEPLDRRSIERAWRDLADRHGARGICRIVEADVRPRAFVVDPLREVTIVIGAMTTPVARFRALHELGHAVAALTVGAVPRVLDEAVAAYIARLLEREGALDLSWYTPLAAPARARRLALAVELAAIERGGPRIRPQPPWALWHDPGAQAAYVAAEAVADRWWADLGPSADPGALARIVSAERTRIDATTQL